MKRVVDFLVLVGAMSSIACDEPTEPLRSAQPNVLLITIETLRADHVGAYGYPRTTTPNLDRLAAQGARFDVAIAQAPFTLPSVASIMTGATPPSHGVRNHPGTLAPELETLAERFRAAGYQTAAMTRHTWLRRKSGLDQGFDEYHNNKFSAGLDARSLSLAAVDWLEARERERPFFLWLHFLDPHLPYTPSYPYSVLYRGGDGDDEPRVKHLRSMLSVERESFEPTPYADIPGGPYYDLVFPYYPDNSAILDLAFWRRSRGSIFFGGSRYEEETVAELRDLYDGAIAYTDDNVARVMKSLSELGIADETVVAVTGDHGEAFGEHELYFTHDFTLYDEVLRVPLVLRYPAAITPGTTIGQQVRLMDLAPTLLELAGVDAAPLAGDAVSLVPLLSGGSLSFLHAYAETAPRRRMFPEHERVYFDGNRGKWRMVRTDRWKLIKIPHPDGDRHELYDLVRDPNETRNLFHELPGEAGKLLPVLEAWMRADPARDADSSAEEDAELEGLDPAAQQQLKTLGYIH